MIDKKIILEKAQRFGIVQKANPEPEYQDFHLYFHRECDPHIVPQENEFAVSIDSFGNTENFYMDKSGDLPTLLRAYMSTRFGSKSIIEIIELDYKPHLTGITLKRFNLDDTRYTVQQTETTTMMKGIFKVIKQTLKADLKINYIYCVTIMNDGHMLLTDPYKWTLYFPTDYVSPIANGTIIKNQLNRLYGQSNLEYSENNYFKKSEIFNSIELKFKNGARRAVRLDMEQIDDKLSTQIEKFFHIKDTRRKKSKKKK